MGEKKYLKEIYELILKYGFNSLKMEEIAEKIGVTKMTIYNNFKSKENLYIYIVSYRSNKFLEFIEKIAPKYNNAIDELLAILAFQRENPFPEIPTYYTSFLNANPRVFALYKAKFRRALKLFVANNIRRGIKEGIYLQNIDGDHIANFTISTMDNMMDKWLSGGAKMNLNTTHEHIIQYHIRGVANSMGLKLLEQNNKLNLVNEINIKEK